MYILIIIMSSWGNNGGVAAHHVEFSRKETCEFALAQLTKVSEKLKAVCVPK